MFTERVKALLDGVGAGQITDVFVVLMFATFVVALVLGYKQQGKTFTAYTPTLLTSLGILGTFFGVVVGLLDFDPRRIDQSITALLAGLQTAFISSLVGMGLSILYRIAVLTPPFRPPVSHQSYESAITIESLYQQGEEQSHYMKVMARALASNKYNNVLTYLSDLSEMLDAMRAEISQSRSERRQASSETIRLLESIHQSLSDDGESSLTGQMKLMRSDANDVGKQLSTHLQFIQGAANELIENQRSWQPEHKQLLESSFEQLHAIRREGKELAEIGREQREKMVALLERSPTEAVVAALKDVINDFNEQLTEQFGENFKELNAAVGRIVEWQENYRGQITEMQNAFAAALQAITQCEQSLTTIDKRAESIPEHMEELADVMRICRHQLDNLDSHLKAFAEVKDRAVESVPALHGIVDEVVRQVGDSTTRMIHSCEASNKQFIAAMQTSAHGLEDSGTRFKEQMTKATESLGNETQSMLEGLRLSMQDQFRLSNENVQQLITKEFEDLDEARKAQVQNIAQQLGAALASISGQFTRDYQRLVQAMNAIVAEGRPA